MFGPAKDPAVAYVRQRFWDEFTANRPRVIILGRWLYTEPADEYSKLNRWPALEDDLNQRYTLVAERNFTPQKRGLLGGATASMFCDSCERASRSEKG